MPQPQARLTSQSMCLGVCSWKLLEESQAHPDTDRAAALLTPTSGLGAGHCVEPLLTQHLQEGDLTRAGGCGGDRTPPANRK